MTAEPDPLPIRVLIVDDEPADREWLARLLRRTWTRRHVLLAAEDGQQAIELAAQARLDVALVDYLLPDVDGLAVVARLLERQPRLAVLLITGEGSETVAARAIQQGAHDYLIKRDVGATDLVRRLERALARVRLEQEHASAAAQLRDAQAGLDRLVHALSHNLGAQLMRLDHALAHLARKVPDGASAELESARACCDEARALVADLVCVERVGAAVPLQLPMPHLGRSPGVST